MALVILLGVLFSQESRPPEFVKFEVARERVGHKVITDAALKNPGAAELSALRVTALYYEGEREVRRSKPVTIPRIAPGQTAAFRIEAEQVPNFTRTDLYLEAGASTRLYVSTEAAGLPALKQAGRASLAVVSHQGAPLTVVVRNTGGTPADEPTAAIRLQSGQTARVRLEKVIPPLSEETFEIAGLPAGAAVSDVAVAWQAADELALPDPPGAAGDLALRQCRAVRLTDGSARVSGILANGSATAVKKIAARFRLGGFDAPYEHPGDLRAGQSQPFVFYVPRCPAFDALSFDLSFEGAAAAGPEAPAPLTARRTATRRVEGEAVKIPPPPAKPAEEAAFAAGERPPSVGVRGLLIAEGSYGKNLKYSGDIYLMKLIFLDGKGKPYQPEATVTFTLYDGEKTVRKAQRAVTRAGWAADAGRLKGADVEFDTVAMDRKTQELWVGLHWTDAPFKKPRADITVEIPNVGTYTIKGVEKDWTTAPQWPDPK
jgi:hypothetical protein